MWGRTFRNGRQTYCRKREENVVWFWGEVNQDSDCGGISCIFWMVCKAIDFDGDIDYIWKGIVGRKRENNLEEGFMILNGWIGRKGIMGTCA